MESDCFCIIAVVFILASVLGCTQSHQDNDVFYASTFNSRKWKVDDNVNISVNLRTPVREVDSRFVSITLDSSLVDHHWAHLDFRYVISCSWHLML